MNPTASLSAELDDLEETLRRLLQARLGDN